MNPYMFSLTDNNKHYNNELYKNSNSKFKKKNEIRAHLYNTRSSAFSIGTA